MNTPSYIENADAAPFTRKVLAWRISNTLEADFCLEALNEAFHKFGPPEIMNTDSQKMGASSRAVCLKH